MKLFEGFWTAWTNHDVVALRHYCDLYTAFTNQPRNTGVCEEDFNTIYNIATFGGTVVGLALILVSIWLFDWIRGKFGHQNDHGSSV